MIPAFLIGPPGASALLAQTVSLGSTTRLQVLDMLEEDDRVAVRWRLSAIRVGEVLDCAMVSMYRFQNGRIAEDWGIFSVRQWP